MFYRIRGMIQGYCVWKLNHNDTDPDRACMLQYTPPRCAPKALGQRLPGPAGWRRSCEASAQAVCGWHKGVTYSRVRHPPGGHRPDL